MKHFLLNLLAAFVCLNSFSQTTQTISCDNYATESIKNVFIEMPDYRELNSGSKIVVTYEGVWPAEMQGAFEYAVKIWEEVLPVTLPINVTAKIGTIRGSGNLLSKVTFDTYNYNGELVNMYSAPLSMIKGCLLQEYQTSRMYRFYDEIEDPSMLDGADMTITYNKNLISQFSFSLDGEINTGKYDFVTLAMRDIAIGLGFTTSVTADTVNKKINFTDARKTPFESVVYGRLNSDDASVAYANATKGQITIGISDGLSSLSDYLIYAPETWVNGTSLRYFIPTGDNPLSNLLTYDFGKDYVVRDLTGISWRDVFDSALDWKRFETTGSTGGSVHSSGTTEDVIPYRGEFSLGEEFASSASSKVKSVKRENALIELQSTGDNDTYATISDYCLRFNAYSPDGPREGGLSLSMLKKDGTWDCVYETYYTYAPIVIGVDSLSMHCDSSDYARGTTGGLRYRLTKCSLYDDPLYGKSYYVYEVKYFTRDYTPQKANIRYVNSYANTGSVQQLALVSDDDYFVDVNVGISNLEGTTKVVVEQLDEGETLPFQYEVSDFRKGYFVANLDRELSTQLTAVCYNENGFVRSNTITIPAIGYTNNSLQVERAGDEITISNIAQNLLESGAVSYSLRNLTNLTGQEKSGNISEPKIYIDDLASGVYLLTLRLKDAVVTTYKFIK